MRGDRYLAPIEVKICTMVELCPVRGFSSFDGDIFRGLQIWGQNIFRQFVFDVASVTCVIYNCYLMRGRAIHEWTSFNAPIWDRRRRRRRRRRLTCDKLSRSSKW